MKSWTPLSAAVVGALLVGGATTGTTRASWSGQAGLAPSSAGAGSMSFTATTPAGVTVTKAAGASAQTSLVVDDTSAGKNLRQRITATITSAPTGITATVGTTCPGAGSVQIDTTPTSVDRTLCVRVASSTTAVSGTVSLTLRGVQQPGGWTTPTVTRTFSVTVTPSSTPPSAPVIACGAFVANGTYSITWTAVSGQTYSAHRATTNTDASYTTVSSSATSPYPATVANGGAPTFWRVRTTNSSGTSGWSNTIRLTRSGNGSSNHTCTVVTP